ncbi:hypothetical protein [Shivajiella indica]|uniref:DUF2442 domain-containing protein n=1 Tax=Shivajiella indica TaxID=872115 RepID=A0ABW5B9I4_9BACT
MSTLIKSPSIIHVQFKGNTLMEIELDNGRTFFIQLDEFPEIKKLSRNEKEDFEVIDGNYLSFLNIDKIYSIKELIGVY